MIREENIMENILLYFKRSVPVGVVALLLMQVYIINELKHINTALTNHITKAEDKLDTQNKQIVDLYKGLISKQK